jgi:Protein of unknown function VcgC/VcgE (DUF2780)
VRINFKVFSLFIAICILTIGFAIADEQQTPSTSLNDNELVKNITNKLSVKPEQAIGGIGSLLGYAKGKLNADDFGKVSKVIPQTDSLISAAPKMDSSVSSAMATLGSSASGIATLGTSFQQLGLSPDMVGKFVPEILNFTQAKGDEATKNILANVLK